MSKTAVYNLAGEEVGSVQLSDKIFATPEVKPEVIQQVVVSMQSSARNTVASAKKRGEVRGGGRKPWKQKGTGRARAGSIRSPLWRGGGITFGPSAARNFIKHVNKKTKRLGLFMAFTDKANDQKIFVVEKFELNEPKTKLLQEQLTKLFEKLSIDGKKTLVITENKNENLLRAARNLPVANFREARNFNILDLLSADQVLITKDALPLLEKIYLGGK